MTIDQTLGIGVCGDGVGVFEVGRMDFFANWKDAMSTLEAGAALSLGGFSRMQYSNPNRRSEDSRVEGTSDG